MNIEFLHPEPPRKRPRIHPVFLPFLGCPHKCVYCNQVLATGTRTRSPDSVYQKLAQDLDRAGNENHPPFELAFFGGTFTGLPSGWTEKFLDLAARYKKHGQVTSIRCSTRPDFVDGPMLARLKTMGLDTVELGIQSFDDAALKASGRGYDPDTAHRACRLVKQAGLDLGVQLMPGMPGQDRQAFERDIRATVDLGPACTRLYPCLVLQGSDLAEAWSRGEYEPWSLDAATRALAEALLALWDADIPVIRLGLAPEPGLLQGVLAGPWHPALGQMVKSLALYEHVKNMASRLAGPVRSVRVPKRYESEFWGHAGDMRDKYAALGIDPGMVAAWDRDVFSLASGNGNAGGRA